jgi:cytochrome c oxidase subunit 2
MDPDGTLPSAPRPNRDWRKRYPPGYDPRKWRRLEWLWTLIPVGLLVIVAILSTGVLFSLDSGPPDPNMHVDVIGHQWYWQFIYTDPFGAQLTNGSGSNQTQGVLYVPLNAVVELNVTSADVVHSFNIPALGVRIDAIPGRINHYWFSIPSGAHVGTTYLIQCTEFCGAGHAYMTATLIVTPPSNLLYNDAQLASPSLTALSRRE